MGQTPVIFFFWVAPLNKFLVVYYLVSMFYLWNGECVWQQQMYRTFGSVDIIRLFRNNIQSRLI